MDSFCSIRTYRRGFLMSKIALKPQTEQAQYDILSVFSIKKLCLYAPNGMKSVHLSQIISNNGSIFSSFTWFWNHHVITFDSIIVYEFLQLFVIPLFRSNITRYLDNLNPS
jgi:hypothetical protein